MKTFLSKINLVALLLLLGAVPLWADPGVMVVPPSTVVAPDSMFQIEIAIDDLVVSLMGYDLSLEFDSSIVELVSVDEGPLPQSGPSGSFFHWFGAGLPSDEVWVNGAVLGTTVDGPGVLFTITFKAVKNGITPVTFISTHMRDGLNVPISHHSTNGEINVDKSVPVRDVTWGEIKAVFR